MAGQTFSVHAEGERLVLRRWVCVVPPRGSDREPLEISQAWLDQEQADAKFVARTRERLANLGLVHEVLERTAGAVGQP